MKQQHHAKALYLSVFTVAYNILEAIASITYGLLTGSSALLGFGLDSIAESLSGGIMIWRFSSHGTDEEENNKEVVAYKLVGYSFFILGSYVAYEACSQLLSGQAPEQSVAGIIIASLSLLITPVLFKAKYRLGKEIGSASLVADSKQTLACLMMSITLLLGAGLHYFTNLWWADPAAALLIATLLLKEGFEILRGEGHH